MRSTFLTVAAAAILMLGTAPTFASSNSIEQHCSNVLAKGYNENPAQWRHCEFRGGHPVIAAPYHGYSPYYYYGYVPSPYYAQPYDVQPDYGYAPDDSYVPYGYGPPPE